MKVLLVVIEDLPAVRPPPGRLKVHMHCLMHMFGRESRQPVALTKMICLPNMENYHGTSVPDLAVHIIQNHKRCSVELMDA
jgi:hypothetical protein